ncbi:hypothetical protein BJ165DRAFT_1321174, partial [Panaeolus papilionaceus]
LRQEFREIELLDAITKTLHEGNLPIHVTGNTRNQIIKEFRQWKGVTYVPKHAHKAIRWSKRDPFEILEDDSNNGSTVAAPTGKERKRRLSVADSVPDDSQPPSKKIKTTNQTNSIACVANGVAPCGYKWSDNSCAYDSVFTIIRHIYT